MIEFMKPDWGISSAGRAPALHAGGQRFDPAILHHFSVVRCQIIVCSMSTMICHFDRLLFFTSWKFFDYQDIFDVPSNMSSSTNSMISIILLYDLFDMTSILGWMANLKGLVSIVKSHFRLCQTQTGYQCFNVTLVK